jgi:hypothetical protein
MAAGNVKDVGSGDWKTIVEPYPETYPFDTEGSSVTGVFESVKQVEQDDMNNPGEKRMANMYTIVDGEKKWGVWGSYNIDEAFKQIHPGETVRIVFDGKVPIDGGRRTVKQFTVMTRG